MPLRAATATLAAAAVFTAPASAGPGFFVAVGEDMTANVVAQQAALKDAGVRGARIWVEWSPAQTEPTPEQVTEISSAVGTGLRIALAVGSSGANAPTDAAARDRYCTFVRSVLARFPTVRDVIVWNEPNKSANWEPQFHADETSAAPAAYTALLARCWDVLHAFRANVNVVGPATSPRGNDNPNAVSNISHSPLTFIRRMGEAYRASGRTIRIFDTFAHHPYGSSSRERPWRPHTHWSQLSQGDWHRTMAALEEAFGGTAQAIPGRCKPGGCVWWWYTEAGYQTSPDESKRSLYTGEEDHITIPDFVGGEPESPPPDVTVPAPDQWTQIIDGVRLAYCQPYVQAWFNYLFVDSPILGGRWQSGFLWADGTQKDSYPAFKQVVAETDARAVDCSRLKGGLPPRPDPLRPAPPGPLAVRAGDRRVAVDWPESPEADVMGYHVFRAARRSGPWRRLTVELVSESGYVDRGLQNRKTYHYAVSAIDTSENQSVRSATGCGTPHRAREAYRPIGGRRVARLFADDGSRLPVRGSRVVRLGLPACHSPIRALRVDVNGRPDARTSFAVYDRLAGSWRAIGALAPSARDRSLRWSTRRAMRLLSPAGELRVRVRSAQMALDWVSLSARY
jgi:hypothetical protein